ncbi:MAG: carbon monoxide dehydrogenase [Dehalococcoidia bacterium]
MAIFDAYLEEVHRYVERLRGKCGLLKETDCPKDAAEILKGLPVRVGPRASTGIIFREDTFVELGSPDTASCAFLLWTDNPALIRDGRITLVGPDIAESEGRSLPFAQVLMVAGSSLEEEHQEALDRSQHVFDHIEGYMIRSVPQRLWSRVSKAAVAKGFGFETLGRALIGIFKTRLPEVEAMEVLFVTSSKEDLESLEGIAAQVGKIRRDIQRRSLVRRLDGTYECTTGYDCSVCSDKAICDEIKELIALRKAEDYETSQRESKSATGATRRKQPRTLGWSASQCRRPLHLRRD